MNPFKLFNRLCYLLAVGICSLAMFCYGCEISDLEDEE